MKNINRFAKILVMGAVLLGASAKSWADGMPVKAEDVNFPAWYFSVGGGGIIYEGDEATKGGLDALLRAGYDYTPRWTFRGEVTYFPELKANTVYNDENGAPVPRPGLDGDSTWAAGVAADALFHFIAEADRHWDPYLIGGIGLLHYEKSRAWRAQTDVPIRAGVGLAYHFTPAWAVNIDAMEHMTLDKQEFDFIPSASVSWSPFARRAARPAGLVPAAPVAQPVAPPPEPAQPPDLKMFELLMNFAEGQSQISPEYFSELDAIAKIIQANPNSDVVIEGHVDQLPKSTDRDAQRLTEKRAEAVRDYFIKNHDISRRRVTAVGYGFSRPKAANDPATGNPANRRIVIHIRAAKNG